MRRAFFAILIIFIGIGGGRPAIAQDSLMNQQPAVGLNSAEYVEYAPTISADGKTMIFQSNLVKD